MQSKFDWAALPLTDLGRARPAARLDDSIATKPASASTTPATQTKATPAAEATDDGPSFWDLVDIINPLQHIPIVNMIYRDVTGDQISGAGRVLGGMLFGGPIGMAIGMADTVVKQATGKDIGETITEAVLGDDAPDEDLAETPSPAPVADPAVQEPSTVAAQGVTDQVPPEVASIAEPPSLTPRQTNQEPSRTATPSVTPHLSSAVWAQLISQTGAVPADPSTDPVKQPATRITVTPDATEKSRPVETVRPQTTAPSNGTTHQPVVSPAMVPTLMLDSLDRYQSDQRQEQAQPDPTIVPLSLAPAS